MLYKKVRTKRRLKKYVIIFLIFVVTLILLFEAYINPLRDKILENRAKVLVENRISEIADDVISQKEYNYDNLLIKDISNTNIVTSLSVNTTEVNKLQNEFSNIFQNKMDDLITQHFSVPIGDLTNLNCFATKGPKITFSYDMTGSVDVQLKSEFKSTGINQTLHIVTMLVDAEIVFVSNSYMENMFIENEFAVSETVIVGDTPDYLYPKR